MGRIAPSMRPRGATPLAQERRALIDALIARGDIAIVHEPRLNGPGKQDDGNYFITLYPQNAEARAWLLQQKLGSQLLATSTGRVEPKDDFHGKYYLNNDALPTMKESSYTPANETVALQPRALPLPVGARAAIVRIAPSENGLRHAMIAAVPFAARDAGLQKLRSEGLLARRENAAPEFTMFVSPENGAAYYAFPLDADVADSLLSNPHGTIADWTQGKRTMRSLQEAMLDAVDELEPVKRTKEAPVTVPPETREEPAIIRMLPSLASQKEALLAMQPRLVVQPQPNGGVTRRLLVDNAAFLALPETSDPLKLTLESRKENEAAYSIGEEEYTRLKAITGPLPVAQRLPLNTNKLRKFFYPKRDHRTRREYGIDQVAFTTLKGEGGPAYYMYVSAQTETRLKDIRMQLQLPAEDTALLTQEEDAPKLLRVKLPEMTWKALQEIAANVEQTRCIALEDGFSLQAFEHEVYEAMGIRRVAPGPDAPAAESPQEPHAKLTNGDAVAYLARQLSGLPPDALLLADIRRRDSNEGEMHLFVRGPVNELNGLANRLNRETAIFAAGSEVRLIHGSKQESMRPGTLQIAVSPTIVSGLAKHIALPKPLAEPLSSDKYQGAILSHFLQQEKVLVQRDAVKEAWQHLRKLYVVPVQVQAPDSMRLTTLETQIRRMDELKEPWDEAEQALRAIGEGYEATLAALGKKGDREAIREFRQGTQSIGTVLQQLQKGIPDRMRKYIEARKAEQRALQTAARTEFLVFDPQHRSERLLAPLQPECFTRLERLPDANDILRAEPANMAAVTEQLPQCKPFDTRRMPQVALDDLAEWAIRKKAEWQAQPQKPKTSVTHIVRQQPEKTAGDKQPAASPWVPARNVSRALLGKLNATQGLLAWERQEPEDRNLPVQASIGLQPVLALSARTHKEREAAKAVYQTLQEAGWLMETPHFYGEIMHRSKCPGITLDVEPKLEDKVERSEQELDTLQQLQNRLQDLTYYIRAGDKEEAQALTAEMEPLLGMLKDKLHHVRLLETMRKMGQEGYAAAGMEAARVALNHSVQKAREELHGLEPDAPQFSALPRARKIADEYVSSIIPGTAALYPLANKRGEPVVFDPAGTIVERDKTAGLKLYLDPRRIGQIEEALNPARTIVNLLTPSQSRALTADEVAGRIHHMGYEQGYAAR